MVNAKAKRFIVTLTLCMAFLFSALGAYGLNAVAADVTQTDVATYYADTRNTVMIIDEKNDDGLPTYYTQLKTESTDSTYATTLATMQRIVAVAEVYEKINKLELSLKEDKESTFSGVDSLQTAFNALSNEKYALLSDIQLSSANYSDYDSDGSLLTSTKALYNKFVVLESKVDVTDTYLSLLSANIQNPSGTAATVVGFYDTEVTADKGYGKAALDAQYDEAMEALDGADVSSSDEVAEAQKQALKSVPCNYIEYIYDQYLTVTAYERGADGVTEADCNSTELYTEMGACQLAYEDFWDGCSEDVKTEYSAENGYITNYFADHQENDGYAPSKNSSSLTYEIDGVTIMTITAYGKVDYDNGIKTLVTTFAPNATIKMYSGGLSGEERNASKLITAKNEDLTIGYLIRFNVYGGQTNSALYDAEAVNEETEGGVCYEVKIDLNNYYEKMVATNQSFISKSVEGTFLESFLGNTWDTEDKLSRIMEAQELLEDSDTCELCYFYNGEELVSVQKINEINNGGTLMITTANFGSLAIAAKDADLGILGQPLFWIILIVGIILVLIIIKLILHFWKYRVKFYPNGGSKVKSSRARYRAYFVMPDNPVREGYVFAGWYEDKQLTKRFIATRFKKRKNLKAYAKWSLELSSYRIDRYYETLRNKLASHCAIAADMMEEGTEKTFAVIEKSEKDIKLYFALDKKALTDDGYNVTDAGDGYAETPTLFTIAAREDYLIADKLTSKLIETYSLTDSDCKAMAEDETKYVLTVTATAEEAAEDEVEIVVEEEPNEEAAEEAEEATEETEEVTEEATEEAEEETEETEAEEATEEAEEETEETEVEEATEEAAEETEEAAEEATEEQLIGYYTTIRNAVCGYALYEKNDKAEDGKMLLKLYKKDEAVYCYFALDAEAYGLETVGLGFGDTPALLKVSTDEDLEKALSLVEVVMLDHGLEKSDEPVEERPYEGKGFGYKIHYVEDEEE